jgi:ribosomal protein L11 methyltransferase
MPSFALSAEIPAEEADDLSADLFELGASGVETRDGSIAPMPGARQPHPGNAILVAWFPDRNAAERAISELSLPADLSPIEDRDWGEEWKRGLAPFSIGRVFVRPSWIPAPAGELGVEVVLDPGMAFGTGTHPTTAICLAAVDNALAVRPGAGLLDVGTGSGLLAIAAKKLGAGRVVATDNDPVALAVARENALLNRVTLELAETSPDRIDGSFDIVVANIVCNVLVELASGLASRLAPGGILFLSGILSHQEEEVRAAYLDLGLERIPGLERRQAEWSLLALRKGT